MSADIGRRFTPHALKLVERAEGVEIVLEYSMPQRPGERRTVSTMVAAGAIMDATFVSAAVELMMQLR